MVVEIILVAGIVLFGLYMVYLHIQTKKYKDKAKEVFENLPEFDVTDEYLSESFGLSIAYDAERGKICLLEGDQPEIYDGDQIIDCELEMPSSMELNRSWGYKLSFGILGTKRKKRKVHSIDLKIIVNDMLHPVYRINFMNMKSGEDGLLYEASYPVAEQWHGIVLAIMNRSGVKSITHYNTSKSVIPVADDLLKLKKLLDAEVITQKEYEAEKRRLLS